MTGTGDKVGLGFALVVALGSVGCQDDGPDGSGSGEREIVPRDGTGWGCRGCGFSNSPVLGLFELEKFHMGPDVVDGFRLVEIRDYNGTSYLPELDGDTLVANKAGVRKSGGQLVGWRLIFQDASSNAHEVEVYSYQTHPDWADGDPVDTYSLVYDDGGELSNVCPGLDPDETTVVMIPGETYDLGANEVHAKHTGWVTLACRGHAVAKMKLLGYDPADGYGSTAEERQATLRMITADYCGDGYSFTQLGQPIQWADARGSFPIAGANPLRVEAKFGPDGAICLDTPRLVQRTAVDARCGKLPFCDGDLAFGGATWITVRP